MGEAVGPYTLIRPLGAGAMGLVHLAEDTRLRRRVALKTLSPSSLSSETVRARLLHEARAAAAISHRNVAAVYDVIDAGDRAHIVMEYVEGEPLSRTIAAGPLDSARVVDIGLQLADGLAAAHARQVVHRDLKPANIHLCPDGTVKILDFGVAKHPLPDADISSLQTRPPSLATMAGQFVGTPAYASPEQLRGKPVDRRADLYSLGLILAEAAAGVRSPAPAVLRAKSPALAAIVAKATAERPDDRYATAEEFAAALRQLQNDRGHGGATAAAGIARWVAAGIGALIAVTGAYLYQTRDSPATVDAAPPVIAVLPFANLTGDAANDHLGSGLADSLTTSLASLPSVTVVARPQSVAGASAGGDARRITRDLGVGYLVNGSVQQAGDRLRVMATLLRADASVAWAESFEGTRSDLFAVQANVATALLRVLEVTVSRAERAQTGTPPTKDPAALDDYWRGRALLERSDVRGNVEQALAAFERAVSRDSGFALAYAALGEANWLQYRWSRDPEYTRRASDAAVAALRLDPDNADVRYSVALTYAGTGRDAEAIDELRRALALRPRHDDARRMLGDILSRRGLIDEAVAEYRKAIAVRPRFWQHHDALGAALFNAGRYEEAAAAFAERILLQPDGARGYHQRGTALQALGRTDEAMRDYQLANEREPNATTYTNIGTLHYQRGEFQQAVANYAKAVEMRPTLAPLHRNLGDALRRLGRRADAARAYARAVSLLEGELAVNPANARTLATLAVYQAKLGRHAEAARAAERAVALAPTDPQVLSRRAVTYALAMNVELALSSLRDALAHGYSAVEARGEEDFGSVRSLPAFTQILRQSEAHS